MPAGHDGDREVESHDRVHRDDQRRRQPRQQQIGRPVAVPVPRRAAPAHRQEPVDILRPAVLGPVPQRRQVRNQSRHTRIRAKRWHTSRPRRRPRPAGCATAARAPSYSDKASASRNSQGLPMWNSGKSPAHATANKRHRLGKAVDRSPPVLLEQEQDRRDQRPGMADPDPPDEIDDRKAPHHRDVDSPDSDPAQEQHGERREQAPSSRQKPIPMPRNHRQLYGRTSTIALILSVTEA